MERVFCPECHSEACVLWDDGYICCSCGCEFDGRKSSMEGGEDDDPYSFAVDNPDVPEYPAEME